MIYKSLYKREASAENYDHSHCYASCGHKTENKKYYPILLTSCAYCGSNKLAPDDVLYWGNLVKTGKVWTY